ncbi:MAG: hypothetical protein V1862_14300 [Methanobacteriota archaeon]
MEIGAYQLLSDPVLITFVILTILAILWRFLKMWIISIITGSIIGSLIVVILVTIGQFAGGDDIIRHFITAKYQILNLFTLSFGQILLILVLIIAFQLALAGHTLDIEKTFQERLAWFPKRLSHHYEMENTLDKFFKKQW